MTTTPDVPPDPSRSHPDETHTDPGKHGPPRIQAPSSVPRALEDTLDDKVGSTGEGKPPSGKLKKSRGVGPSSQSTNDRETHGNQHKTGEDVNQRSLPNPPTGDNEGKEERREDKAKQPSHSSGRTITQHPTGRATQHVVQPDVDAGVAAEYELVSRHEALAGEGGVRDVTGAGRSTHHSAAPGSGSGSSDGSTTRQNYSSAEGGGGGHKGRQVESSQLPPRPRNTHEEVTDDTSIGNHGEPDPVVPGGLSHPYQNPLNAHRHQNHQQGPDEEPNDGSSAGPGWLPSLTNNFFGRSGSSSASGAPNAPPRRDKTKEELVNTKRELERVRKESAFYRQEMEQSNYNLQQAIGDNRVYARNIQELQGAKARLKDHLHSCQHELANVQRKLDDAKVLAETRGRELQGAQVFLTKADSLAISDLSARVTQLNEEIFQAAASLGEAVCRKQWSLPDEEAIRCAEDASRLIGPYLVRATHEHAKNPDAPVHPFLVQVVLQVFLNTFCVEKIRMWAPSEPIHDDYIRSLYQAIWEKEEQAVSGRWRALTRSQLRPDISTWSKELLDSLMKVFQSASWDLSSPEAQRTIENQLSPIFKGILEVRMALGEKFTSADIEVISIEFGQTFNRAYMEDAYGDDRRGGGNTEPDTVFATAGMALRKSMPPSSQFRYEKVLPAKVVLESSLKAALEPAPSRDRGKRRKPVDTKATPHPPPPPPPPVLQPPEHARPEHARPEHASGDTEMSDVQPV